MRAKREGCQAVRETGKASEKDPLHARETSERESCHWIIKPVAESITDQIGKLAELHKSGILSDEEFSEKKTELLKVCSYSEA